MTEDKCRIGDPKMMTNTKGVPYNYVGAFDKKVKSPRDRVWIETTAVSKELLLDSSS